jgi:ATP-dependent protease Clp ATPase subunit
MNAVELHSQSHTFCSFCTKSRNELGFLIEKPAISICDNCVRRFDEQLADQNYGEKTEPYRDCSFCSFMQQMPVESLIGTQPPTKGFRLVRRSKFAICDECLGVCKEMVDEHEQGL